MSSPEISAFHTTYLDAAKNTANTILTNLATYPTPSREQIFSKNVSTFLQSELEFKKRIFAGGEETIQQSHIKAVARFGVYVAVVQEATFDWDIDSDDFTIKKGDLFVNVHMPPRDPNEEKPENGAYTTDYFPMAQWITKHHPTVTHVIGVTYERLASASKKNDFKGKKLPLDEETIQRANDFRRNHLIKGDNNQDIWLIYHTIDSFNEKFGGKTA